MKKSEIIWHEVFKRPLTADEIENLKEFSVDYMLDSDELPDDGEEVLVAVRTNIGIVVTTATVTEVCGIYDFAAIAVEKVIAWARFPEYVKE